MVERWAMIENGTVINVVAWDGNTSRWQPPEGVIMKQAPDYVGMYWRYENDQWLEPIPPPAEG